MSTLHKLLCACAWVIAAVPSALAQERTETGYTMDWTRTLQERADPLVNARHTLTGRSFVVYECGAGEAMGYWKKRMEELGGAAKSSKPVRVTGASVPGLGIAVPLVLANVQKDREAGGVRLIVAFALNDTTAAPDDPGMPAAVHDMAVQVNRAVVQRQIVEQEARLKKITGQVKDAQKEEAKASEQAGDAGKDLEKVNEKQAKLARKQADLQKELAKLQAKYQSDQDPKTLEKIAKTQQRIADGEKDVAKAQQAESKAQAHKNKHEEAIPDAQKLEQKQQTRKDLATRELEALKRKLEAIR